MTSPAAEQERPPRDRTVGGSVSPEEEREILDAFGQAKMPVKARATRAVLLSFARSTKVRDAVYTFLNDNRDLLAS